MAVIDHRYFPHIIDLIFDHAELEALSVMRWVCSEWRQRVAAEFYHLREFSVTARPPWTDDSHRWLDLHGRQNRDAQHNVVYRFRRVRDKRIIETRSWACCSIAKVLDLDTDAGFYGYEKTTSRSPVLLMDTLRLKYGRIENFSPVIRNTTAFAPLRIVSDHHLALDTKQRVNKLVINYRHRDRRPFVIRELSGDCCSFTFEVCHLVFIVHLDEAIDDEWWEVQLLGEDGFDLTLTPQPKGVSV